MMKTSKHNWIRPLLLSSFLSIGASASTQENLSQPEDTFVNARVGAGISVQPNTFSIMGNLEYRADDHFAIGPMLQAGLSAETKFYLPTIEGRLILTDPNIRKSLGIGLEASVLAGIGMNFREVQGFRFNDFVYQFGINVDALIAQGFTMGLAATFNLSDNSYDGFFPGFFGSIGYQF